MARGGSNHRSGGDPLLAGAVGAYLFSPWATNLLSGRHPPPWATQGCQLGFRVGSLMIFRGPRGGFGAPFGPLGPPRGAQIEPKSEKKTAPGALCGPKAILERKGEGPDPQNVAKT